MSAVARAPVCRIIAGPNGAGKTTFALKYLPQVAAGTAFVNADLIAAGLSPLAPEQQFLAASRLFLQQIKHHVAEGRDFAFETTLSGYAFLSAMERWRSAGYTIRIVYLWLNSPETAIDRVHARARQGGHIVPDDVIRRRYTRGLLNFAHRYRDAADRWHVYDSTDPLDRRAVARGSAGVVDVVDDELWERFQTQVSQISRIREILVANRATVADDHIERWFADPENLERAMRIVHARVIRRHRLLDQPLITWRDGKVVELDPHTVPMPDGVTEEQMGPVFDYL